MQYADGPQHGTRGPGVGAATIVRSHFGGPSIGTPHSFGFRHKRMHKDALADILLHCLGDWFSSTPWATTVAFRISMDVEWSPPDALLHRLQPLLMRPVQHTFMVVSKQGPATEHCGHSVRPGLHRAASNHACRPPSTARIAHWTSCTTF